jgi:D-threonate/D-erythronate kinase
VQSLAGEHWQNSDGCGRYMSAIGGGATAQSVRSLVILGDDLSGTTEALAASLGGDGRGWVHLGLSNFSAHFAHADGAEGGQRAAVDLDVRHASPAVARNRYVAAVQATLRHERSDVLLLKVDSLLRGNVAAALAAVPPAPQRPVVLAPALPSQGRRTLRGRVHLAEAATRLPGSLEGAQSDVALAAGCATAVLDLDVVRAGPQILGTALGRLAEQGIVAVCDAERDEDLDAVAAAAIQHRRPVVVGAGGVAAALGRVLPSVPAGLEAMSGGGAADGCSGRLEPTAPVLVVVGTAEPSSRPQVARLQQAGAGVESVDPSHHGTARDALEPLDRALRHGCAVLQVAPGSVDVHRSSRVLDRLADTAASVLAWRPLARVVLTGGATARAVLTRLGVDTLRLQCQVHPGAAHLRIDDGRHVVTRPGSHGGVDSLAQLAYHLGAPLPRIHSESRTTAHHSTEGQE